jgi:hypothetical protein
MKLRTLFILKNNNVLRNQFLMEKRVELKKEFIDMLCFEDDFGQIMGSDMMFLTSEKCAVMKADIIMLQISKRFWYGNKFCDIITVKF